MDQGILNTILNSTYSLSQLNHRLRILKSYLLQTFFGGQSTTPIEGEDLDYLKSLPPSLYQHFTKDNIYQLFSDIEGEIKKLPILTVYLSFEPDIPTTAQIGIFTRNAFKPDLLMDIKLDPGLIAGPALVWKGVYKDYSLKAKIEARKAEILQGFKKFLR